MRTSLHAYICECQLPTSPSFMSQTHRCPQKAKEACVSESCSSLDQGTRSSHKFIKGVVDSPTTQLNHYSIPLMLTVTSSRNEPVAPQKGKKVGDLAAWCVRER